MISYALKFKENVSSLLNYKVFLLIGSEHSNLFAEDKMPALVNLFISF